MNFELWILNAILSAVSDIGLGTCLEQSGQQVCVGIGGQIYQVLLDHLCMNQRRRCWEEEQGVKKKIYCHPGTTQYRTNQPR
jgi:hypothetical protein